MRVLVSRPRDDAERIAAPLRAMGVEVVNEPLLVIVPVAGPNIDLTGVQAVLMTSANGARALATAVDERDMPVFAVGDQTARAARDVGFNHVESAGGNVETLAALVRERLNPDHGPLLHAAGRVQAGDLAGALDTDGFTVRVAHLYDARPTAALSRSTQAALRDGTIDAAFFFSPRTARTFVEHVRKATLERSLGGVTAYALSAAVARELDPILSGRIRVSDQPTQESLLDVFKADVKEAALKPPEHARPEKGTSTEPSGAGQSAGPSDETTPGTDTAADNAPRTDRPEETDTADNAAAPPASKADDPSDPAGEDRPDEKPEDKPDEKPDEKPDDRHHDDGDGVYAGSAGRPAEKAAASDASHAREQAEHRTMRSIVRWFVILVIAGAVAFGSMPWWRDKVPGPLQSILPTYPESVGSAAVGDLETRVADLTASVKDLSSTLASTAETAETALAAAQDQPDSPEAGATAAQVEALRGRLDALEQALTDQATTGTGGQEATAAALGVASDRLDTLESRVAAMEDTLAAIEDTLAQMGTRLEETDASVAATVAELSDGEARAVGLMLSVGLLRQQVDAGKPYASELSAVAALAPGEDVTGEMDALDEHAATGVRTLPELRRAFNDVSSLAARRTIVPEGDSFWSDTVSSLMDGITVRRKDDVIAGGGLAALSSAEVLLAEGNLTGAIEALDELKGDAGKVVADWMADAQARASVDSALASLNAAALARVGGGPTTE
ncbi:uroporphyrinogen-III synthase [Roseospira navarrensis]|uniref:Tetrapyrrole biosynthesis uroporphyrinogen III synthase domain-containing protein n=1 Tax=Roseospira navarrensis TaxID=140058 RepID=A0A7X1ZE30_9PROT|nr:uroporphyrinogen-III synthase [Roseospira navarrensis]MQX35535.1 hypothetical protein [Roseospira navarrensis]